MFFGSSTSPPHSPSTKRSFTIRDCVRARFKSGWSWQDTWVAKPAEASTPMATNELAVVGTSPLAKELVELAHEKGFASKVYENAQGIPSTVSAIMDVE